MQAFFLAVPSGGQRFCLFHPPQAGCVVRGGLVYIHPFAEELNRSRRMAVLQARAFARAGYAVLQIDLEGCGDSSGDFESATWESWIADVTTARQWLAERTKGPLWLWGLRAGCLLAAEVAKNSIGDAQHLLLWQPVMSGQQHLNQFLRLKLAADVVQGTRSGGSGPLALALSAGQAVEVAGYSLGANLSAGLGQASLGGLPPGSRVTCFEVSGVAGADVSPALINQIAQWSAAGCIATASSIHGVAFWQTMDMEPNMDLGNASLTAVAGGAV